MLSEREDIAIAELAVYIPSIILAIGIIIRHGFSKGRAWIYLIVFCGLRIASAILEILSVKHPTNRDDATWTAVLGSIGLSPLFLVTCGLLIRVYASQLSHCILHSRADNKPQQQFHHREYSPCSHSRVASSTHLARPGPLNRRRDSNLIIRRFNTKFRPHIHKSRRHHLPGLIHCHRSTRPTHLHRIQQPPMGRKAHPIRGSRLASIPRRSPSLQSPRGFHRRLHVQYRRRERNGPVVHGYHRGIHRRGLLPHLRFRGSCAE